ncbi:MFS family permease [Catenulispora sp. EB89]|uniref:MFS transporter n=1 Tax=Catenulispora sp. EB89 TaxID=3156257 RepID=UPI003511BBE2
MSDQARRSRGVLPALVLSVLAFSLVQTSVVPILPTLQKDLNVAGSGITWLMTANLLSAAVLTPLLARIGDLRGRKPMLVVAIAGVLVGGVLGGIGGSFGMLLIARIVAGTGGAILPLAVAVVRDELPREKVTGGVAMVSAALGVGSGLGLVATGLVVEHFSYQAVFWMGAILAAIAFALVLVKVPHDPIKAEGKADPLGALLLAGWLSALLIAVSQGNDWGWGSTRTMGLFVTAAVVLVVWVVVERRVASPLVDISMLAKPAIAVTNTAGVLVGFAMYGSFLLMSDFTQTPKAVGYGFGATVLASGWMLFPSAVGSFAAAPVGAALIKRSGPRLPLVLGGAFAAVGLGLLVFAHSSSWHVVVASGVMGVGVGMAYAAMPAYINASVPVQQSGIANGMNAVLRTVGGAVGTAVIGAVLTGNMKQVAPGVKLPTVDAYTHAFLIASALALVAAVVPFLVKTPRMSAMATPDTIDAEADAEAEADGIGGADGVEPKAMAGVNA